MMRQMSVNFTTSGRVVAVINSTIMATKREAKRLDLARSVTVECQQIVRIPYERSTQESRVSDPINNIIIMVVRGSNLTSCGPLLASLYLGMMPIRVVCTTWIRLLFAQCCIRNFSLIYNEACHQFHFVQLLNY